MRASARRIVPAVLLPLLMLSGCLAPGAVRTEPAASAQAVPRPDHVVVVILENKHRSSVLGNPAAPYLNRLAAQGANLTRSYGVTHPSQPNYLALFSGSQQGVTSNDCPVSFPRADNLGRQLRAAGLSFVGYADAMPSAGYTGCSAGQYRRKHNPWVNFGTLPASTNQPFTAFPSDFSELPTVAFVSPDMCHDMHDCPVSTGDAWLEQHLDGYAQWAKTHNSLLVVTFDENAGGTVNQIATLVVGQSVRPGSYAEQVNHYSVLRTIEDAYGLAPLGHAATATPLRSIWTTSQPAAPAPSLANPGFELGVAGWAVSGSTATTRSSRHGGSLVARAGSPKPTRGDSIISQTFTAPAGASKLSVSWLGRCADTTAHAWATILVKRNTSGKLSTVLPRTCVARGAWTKASVKITAGHSYTVRLVNHDDGAAGTPNRTYFDDVTIS